MNKPQKINSLLVRSKYLVIFLGLFKLAMAASAHDNHPISPTHEHSELAVDTQKNTDIDDNGENDDEDEVYDPLEPLNRVIFAFNQVVDKLVLVPLSYAFQDLLADEVQDIVKNFFGNLGEPIVFINDVLQGEADLASESLFRFLINSTVGILGLCDVASDEINIQAHKQDLGITFARWGIESGPYLMLPILGPSNFRDALGKGGDYYLDPYNIYMRNHRHKKGLIYARSGANGIIQRQSILEVTEGIDKEDDPYVQYRSLYSQNREYVIKGDDHGKGADVPKDIE